jgi:hypothetical protein
MKRGSTCGTTPMTTTERKGEPAARSASIGFIDISSIASAINLAMKPMVATISARMPASAPKPTALTKRMATMTGWKVRQSAIKPRARIVTGSGIRLRAAQRPTGRASRTPAPVAMIAICSDSSMPCASSCSLSCARFGGNMRPRKRAPLPRPWTKRSQRMSTIPAA